MVATPTPLSAAWSIAYAFARSQPANEPTASGWADHIAETGATHLATDVYTYRQWFEDMVDQGRRLIADLDLFANA